MAPDIAHCSLHIAHCSLWGKSPRGGSWSQSAVNKPWRLSMNRLVTGNLSLVTGDWQMLFPRVTLFSISSYQLPVTSDKSKRFMVPRRGEKPSRLPMIQERGQRLACSPRGLRLKPSARHHWLVARSPHAYPAHRRRT